LITGGRANWTSFVGKTVNLLPSFELHALHLAMKHRVLLALLATASFLVPAVAAQPDSNKRSSALATVQLLATGRITGGGAPDGMQFMFLVAPGPGVVGPFSLKETRDFTVEGISYQEKTQAELGKRFEPRSNINKADAFFAQQPALRGLAPEDINGAHILVVAIGGARFPDGSRVEVTAEVGYGKTVEPFKFNVNAPPAPTAGATP